MILPFLLGAAAASSSQSSPCYISDYSFQLNETQEQYGSLNSCTGQFINAMIRPIPVQDFTLAYTLMGLSLLGFIFGLIMVMILYHKK